MSRRTKLLYLSEARIPGTRAVSIQQMLMCEAFQASGFDVDLVHPSYLDSVSLGAGQDVFKYYGVDTRFRVTRLPSLMVDGSTGGKPLPIPRIGGLSMTLSFALDWLRRSLLSGDAIGQNVAIYSRNIRATYVILQLQRAQRIYIPHYFEVHRLDFGHSGWFFKAVLPRLHGVVAITRGLGDGLVQRFGVPEAMVIVEPDAAALERFVECAYTICAARSAVGLPDHPTKIVGYVGQFYEGRGVDQLVQAAQQVHGDVLFLLVGGHPKDQARIRELVLRLGLEDRVLMKGFVPPREVVPYLAACDVLVAPYTTNFAIAEYTSPLKIFEYMAARKPIVVGRLKVLEEVLESERNCLMVRPGDAADLALGISRVLVDNALANRIADNAYRDVQQYTWKARAARIKQFIERTSLTGSVYLTKGN